MGTASHIALKILNYCTFIITLYELLSSSLGCAIADLLSWFWGRSGTRKGVSKTFSLNNFYSTGQETKI